MKVTLHRFYCSPTTLNGGLFWGMKTVDGWT